jgi:hypothetical protein
MNSPALKWIASAFMLLTIAVGSSANARILSNGTGGGDWATPSTWTGGIVPATTTFLVQAGDTVNVESGVNYSYTGTNDAAVLGILNVNTGASIEVARLQNAAASGAGIINVAGGAFNATALLNNESHALTFNVSSGGTLTQYDTGSTAAGVTLNANSGGTVSVGVGTVSGSASVTTGGIFEFRNGYEFVTSGFTWNGGTVITNTGNPGASGSNGLMNAWKSNATNELALSSKTTKQTLTLGTGSDTVSVDSAQGVIRFNVYSSTPNDSDHLGMLSSTSSTMILSPGVRLAINGLSLVGTPEDYIGKSYQFFSLASGVYANINPTIDESRWTIGARLYIVKWTDNLAVNGSVTVANVTPVEYSAADFSLPAQDANGWTILTPSTDSRLVYVDPVNGDDTTGTFYVATDSFIGPNPQAPVGSVLAFKTIAKAFGFLRPGYPDWMLLKAGEVFSESFQVKYGRSATERSVVAPYGTGARPELRTGANGGISTPYVRNIIITGIKFWAHTRDTDGPYFSGTFVKGGNAFHFYNQSVAYDPNRASLDDILIEDCVFRSYGNGNIQNLGGPGAMVRRVALRRNIISGSYQINSHAQGVYYYGKDTGDGPAVLLQENTLDHNGWRIQSYGNPDDHQSDGQATMFNHNTYFANARGVVFDGNLFLRASSIGTKWTANEGTASAVSIAITDNLFVEGEIGISMGGNKDGTYRFQDIAIRDNVMTDIGRTHPTNRSLAWYMGVLDWKFGEITGNLLIHQRDTSIANAYGIDFTTSNVENGATDDVIVSGNIIAGIRGGTGTGGSLVKFRDGNITTGVVFQDNIVQSPTATPLASFTTGGFAFSGTNRYWSTAVSNKLFVVNGSFTDLAGWQAATGDNGAITAAPTFPDATRDVESYIQFLGLGATFEDFLIAVYGQSKANWNPALTARAVNDWIREGFGMPPID